MDRVLSERWFCRGRGVQPPPPEKVHPLGAEAGSGTPPRKTKFSSSPGASRQQTYVFNQSPEASIWALFEPPEKFFPTLCAVFFLTQGGSGPPPSPLPPLTQYPAGGCPHRAREQRRWRQEGPRLGSARSGGPPLRPPPSAAARPGVPVGPDAGGAGRAAGGVPAAAGRAADDAGEPQPAA